MDFIAKGRTDTLLVSLNLQADIYNTSNPGRSNYNCYKIIVVSLSLDRRTQERFVSHLVVLGETLPVGFYLIMYMHMFSLVS